MSGDRTVCSVDWCSNQAAAGEYREGRCVSCYLAMKPRLSNEEVAKRIAARTTLDVESGCLLWTASVGDEGYGRIRLPGYRGSRQVHRVAYELEFGPIGDDFEIDHVDCISRACCNPRHLRPVTKSQNMQNRQGPNGVAKNNTSGYRGVRRGKSKGNWIAQAQVDGKPVHIGTFSDRLDAARAACAFRLRNMPHSEHDRRLAIELGVDVSTVHGGPGTEVQTFRKKPVMVEAMQWTGRNVAALENWTDAAFIAVDDRTLSDVTGELYIAFSGTCVGVQTGDWVLRDSNGFHLCKASVFVETYEPSLFPSLLDEDGGR